MNGEAPRLPGSLRKSPAIDSWIAVNADGTITARTGKVEIGQGIKTAIALIAAEELDVALERIRVVSGVTGETADEGVTSGSGSMEQSGRAMRQVAAEARAVLVALAADRLDVEASALEVEDGAVRSPATNQQVTYWEILGGKPFGRDATGEAQPKKASSFRLVGRDVPELDGVAKVTGGPVFIHDLAMPGMLHARLARPPSYSARLQSVDTKAAEAVPGVVKVVRDGRYLAVIAETEWAAMRARVALAESARWEEEATLPDEERLYEWLVSNETAAHPVVDGTPTEDPVPDIAPPEGAALTLEATYGRPYHMHGSLGPSAAAALAEDGRLTIWSAAQGPYPLQRAVAGALGMKPEAITVHHVQGAGCYGHNGADDAAFDAALLALQVPGRPVHVQWLRADEHRWEPYGPGMVVATSASLDGDGNVIDFNLDLWSTTHQGRPRPTSDTSGLLGAWLREHAIPKPESKPNFSNESGAHRNANPYYDFPRRRIVAHFVKETPLRTSSFRGLGNYANIFAIESFMDELAHASGQDPLAFRLRHLSDERGRAVLEAVAEAIGWPPGNPGTGRGKGIAFNRYKNGKAYCAVAVEAEVDEASGAIRIVRAVVAGDAGQVVNPGGLRNQLEGGVLQAISWTLKERVRFDPVRVTSVDWESYPILTLREAPRVESILIDRADAPYLGTGEGSQGPGGAAIANAAFNAIGVRLRELPLTPDRVRRMIVEARAGGRG
ncbi:MAG TPA: molybdopterin cofactor-binding domain-containing protein [Alphaproteobacteria bacterium]